MLIVTAKVPRKRLAFGAVLAAFLCCCTITLTPIPHSREALAPSIPAPSGIRSNQDRVEYLRSYGWEIQEEPISTQELMIPDAMDESYTDYLSLQSQQGFDLTKYAGKRVKRYTYEVLNHPSGESGVQANLLLYKNTVVGGEVLSPELDGFLHGLTMP